MQPQVLNGRYELLTPLGQGGMATVYRGRDIRLGRPIAIKLLHNYYANDDEFLQRFQHEAMSAAHLSSHPNIVDVYDVGQEGDLNYIVMELIEGKDLKALIETQAPLPPEQALTITAQVADGLEYAHRRGLVHRDVKPQNVLMTPDGQVRIADFGIAKSHLSTAVTQAGMTFGTADYISPEQAQGLNATPQSDVYSLGVVLYELLTGRLPFVGDTPMAVAIQHIQNPPPPPRQLNPSIPPALEALVMRTIAKDPQHRPESAKAFAQELRDYLAGRNQQTVVTPVMQPPRQPAPQPRQPQYYQDSRDTTYEPAPPPPQRRPVQRPQYAAPPPLAVAPPRERSGFGFGTLLIGLLLLGGVLALAYFALNDLPALFNANTGGSASPAPVTSAAPSTEPTPAPEPTGTPQPLIAVPRLVGQRETEAVRLLDEAGLPRRVDPNDPTLQPRFDPQPPGTIIEQEPEPGTQIEQGTPIRIVVSLGGLPSVTGLSPEAAQQALQGGGVQVQQRDAPSESVAAGLITRQEPAAGSAVARGGTVTLTVSQGDVVAFPNVLVNGTLLDEARQQIEAAGFSVVAVDLQGADRLPNYDQYQPNEVVSAAANGEPVNTRGKLVPRGAEVALGVRAP